MNHSLDYLITSVGMTWAPPEDVRTGLIGYVTCVIDDEVILDGITLRITAQNRPTLSFPARTDSRGRRHPIIRFASPQARDRIQAEIFDRLGITIPPGEEEGATS
jgi:hypothetical protein